MTLWFIQVEGLWLQVKKTLGLSSEGGGIRLAVTFDSGVKQ